MGTSMLIQPQPGSLRLVEDAEEEIFHLFTNLKEQGRHGLGYATVHSDRITVQLHSASAKGGDEMGSRPAGTSRGHRGQALQEECTFQFPSGTITIGAAEDGDEDEEGEGDVTHSETTRRKTGAVKKQNVTVSRPKKLQRRTTSTAPSSATDGDNHKVVLRQDFTSFRTVAGNTGSVAWRASMALAALLINDLKLGADNKANQASLLNSNALLSDEGVQCQPRSWTVLELGAGTGVLSSLVLTHPAWRSLQRRGSSASTLRWIATDQGEVLELLRRNVNSTNRRLARHDVDAHVSKIELVARDLDWVEVLDLVKRGDERAQRRLKDLKRSILARDQDALEVSSSGSDDEDQQQPDLILAIDCIFNPALFPALLATLALFSAPRSPSSTTTLTFPPTQTQVLVACELREVDMMRAFLEAWCGGSTVYLGEAGKGGRRGAQGGPAPSSVGSHPGWIIHGWEGGRREEDDEEQEGVSEGLGPGFAVWLATPRSNF
ncbi:hypothetical protein A4X13_0g2648 [Tilletia indica]|uniref:Uncharacterized protein n=1 Tax=Tilletia indica TaxID=43049 RepID=A0A177TAI8_9BASI|nr:hypothetical protein A4X13_0g2648 [Tilletia indica]